MFFICRLFYSQMCIFTFCLNTWDKNDNSARPLSLHAASCFFLLHFPLFDLTCSPTPLGVVRVHFVCVRACACARVHADDAPHPEDRPRACVCVYARAPTRKMINYVNQNVKMLRTARTNTLQQFLCVCGLANECLIVLALTLDRDPAWSVLHPSIHPPITHTHTHHPLSSSATLWHIGSISKYKIKQIWLANLTWPISNRVFLFTRLPV